MKLKKSTFLPIVLFCYLAFMAYIGYPALKAGEKSPWEYYGAIAGTAIIIVVLHFFLKKKERLKREREEDINRPL